MHTVSVLAAAPHLFETPDMTKNVEEFFLKIAIGLMVIYVFDLWADKIPGVNKWNHGPHAAVLLTCAAVASGTTEWGPFAIVPDFVKSVTDRMSSGISIGWNVTGTVLTFIAAGFYAARYCGFMEKADGEGGTPGERLKPDGFMFGVCLFVGSSSVPWIGWVLELWQYSMVTGMETMLTAVIDSVGRIHATIS